MKRRSGFTLVELAVVLAASAVGGSLAVALWGYNGDQDKLMRSQTQLRGIHQSCVVFAQSNKKGGNDGFFPGLDSSGQKVDVTTAGRLQMMLRGNFFTGEYIISPVENLTPWEADGWDERPLFPQQFSYAMLDITGADDDAGRRMEWMETLSTSAVVIGDRNAAGADASESVWTQGAEAEGWAGGLTRNDNSTSFDTSPTVEMTKFGSGPANELDNIFKNETRSGFDTLLTFAKDQVGLERAVPRRNTEHPPKVPRPRR